MKPNIATPGLRPVLLASTTFCAVLTLTLTAHAAPAAGQASADPSGNGQSANSQAGKDQTTEVIVTAERRSSTLQKTAAAVTVKSGQDMIEQGRTGLGAILEDVPGVTFTGAGATTDSTGLSVVIRGVQPSSTAGGASSAPPTTAAYVDGVFNGIGGDYDLARVEVLRGPQGTLYGRSATSGVVNIVTNDPVLRRNSADILAEAGTANYKHVTGDVNLALGDSFALRLAGNDSARDGYDSPDGGYNKTAGGRLKLLYKPSDDVRILIGASKLNQTLNTGGVAHVASGDDTYTTSSTSVGSSKYVSNQYWAQIDWNLGWANLTYIPTYRDWSTGGVSVIGPDIIHQFNAYPRDNFVTHELRLTSDGSDRLTWLVGAFYYRNAYENATSNIWWHSQALTWKQDINKRTTNVGLFGESTYHFSPDTRLTLGVRVDQTRVDTFGYYTANVATPAAGDTPFSTTWFLPEVLSTATLTPQEGLRRFDNTTYKLRLEHNLSQNNLVYGTVSTGFVPGDTQFTTINGGATILPYDQESLTAYELGTKNRVFDGRLTLNGDVFYYDYGGYQTTVNTSGDPQNPSYAVYTAPAKMSGVEIEGRWMITAANMINFAYSHTSADYKDRSAAFQTYVAQTAVPGIAPDSASLGFEHGFALRTGFLKAQAEARYTARYQLGATTADEAVTSEAGWNFAKAATILNASLTWTSLNGGYALTLYGRNLGDTRTWTSMSFQDYSITLTDPRTVGLVLQAHF